MSAKLTEKVRQHHTDIKALGFVSDKTRKATGLKHVENDAS